MHFYASAAQIKKGVALASPLESLSKNFLVGGSIKSLNGGLGRNRTADTRLFRALLYRLSYQPTVALKKENLRIIRDACKRQQVSRVGSFSN